MTIATKRLSPVSDNEVMNAKTEFVEAEAAKLLKTNLFDLFCGLNGTEEKILQTLMSGSMLELIHLQETFKPRMEHEARAIAEGLWTPSVAAESIMRIQDGRVNHA